MESACIMVDSGEWNSFNGVSVNEEADFMAQLFPHSSISKEQDETSDFLGLSCWTSQHSDMASDDSICSTNSLYSSDTNNSNYYSLSQGSNSSFSAPYPCHDDYYMNDPNQYLAHHGVTLPIDFGLTDPKGFIQALTESDQGSPPDDLIQPEFLETHLQLKSENEMPESDELDAEDKISDSSETTQKRRRTSYKGKRSVRSKKNQKLSSDDEDNDPALARQNSTTGSSEEDSNGCPETSVGAVALNSSGKTRASRGSATDPQSLYARKRRERINERLRMLQGLVPNGTKVDISTMLEEAVHYVKFLQLQIKLLSSDDMWMYAPLAYNGMDIGLESKLNSLTS